MSLDSLTSLRARLREFAAERDWEQFHTPKNLSCAIAVEAAELLEIFQWSSGGSEAELNEVQHLRAADEIADVLFYLVMLADRLSIDIPAAAEAKLTKNAVRYPVEASKGKATKYTELDK